MFLCYIKLHVTNFQITWFYKGPFTFPCMLSWRMEFEYLVSCDIVIVLKVMCRAVLAAKVQLLYIYSNFYTIKLLNWKLQGPLINSINGRDMHLDRTFSLIRKMKILRIYIENDTTSCYSDLFICTFFQIVTRRLMTWNMR